MPYTKPNDAPEWVADDKKAQWVEVFNSVYKAKKKDGATDKEAEGAAFKQAGGVVSEKKGLTMTMKREFRSIPELRADSQGDEMAIAGYAALFNSESKDLGGFKEKIAPGAFTRSLEQGDAIYCLFNHDSSRVLGSTKNETLKLSTDEHGLKFRCIINPKDSEAVATHARIERGDINECSFAFTVNKDGQQWQELNGNEDFFAMRTLTDVNLLDVSAVSWPAYGGTNVAARALFPDGIPMEVRSALDAAAMHKAMESRDLDEDECYEEEISEVCKALAAQFPAEPPAAGECGYSYKYWVCETYPAYVIAQECTTGDYFSIPYHEDEENETYLFGTPEPVEKEWVPSERCKKVSGENRAAMDSVIAQHKQAAADAAAAAAAASGTAATHEEAAATLQAAEDAKKAYRLDNGLLDDEDFEDDVMADPDDCFDELRSADPDDSDSDLLDDLDELLDSENEAVELYTDAIADLPEGQAKQVLTHILSEENDHIKLLTGLGAIDDRSAKPEVEKRADGKVLTKKVGGKNLTKDKFAFVGDAEKTTTWKLPIHDADHVRNALARFNQTKGIPADKKAGVLRKIKAAASKFGIHVSEEDSIRALDGCPMDEQEIWERQVRARLAIN